MHSLEIKDIAVITTEDGDQMSVEVEINDGEKSVLRRFGYPLGTSQEAIEADLKNVVAGLDSDASHQAFIAEHDEQLKQVDEMRKSLEGRKFDGSSDASKSDEDSQ